MKLFSFLLVFIFLNTGYTKNLGSQTGLDLPRYVSLKSNESNIRVGPSKNYPIILKYVTSNFPLKVIEEYNNWRKVIDFENNTGWIHKRLLKNERNAIIKSDNIGKIYIFNTKDGKVIGEIGLGLIVKLNKCEQEWCLIIKNNEKGWINKKYLWGVKKDEKFNVGIFQKIFDYYFKSVNMFEKLIIK